MAVTGAIQSDTTLSGADIGVVIVYFIGVIGVGLFVSTVIGKRIVLSITIEVFIVRFCRILGDTMEFWKEHLLFNC